LAPSENSSADARDVHINITEDPKVTFLHKTAGQGSPGSTEVIIQIPKVNFRDKDI
jgi:hypothetical protein